MCSHGCQVDAGFFFFFFLLGGLSSYHMGLSVGLLECSHDIEETSLMQASPWLHGSALFSVEGTTEDHEYLGSKIGGAVLGAIL